MADESGSSTRDGDAVVGDITTREGLREALRQILREEPSLLQATTAPTGPPPAGECCYNPHFPDTGF